MNPDSPTLPSEMSVDSQVIASGEAHVGEQIGTQFVGSVLHDAKIYTTLAGDPPDRLHEVARAHLDGGNPCRAEEILRSLFVDGHFTTERAYLYVLSVLSDRSFTEITAELSDEISHVVGMAASSPRDDWRTALDVVDLLLRYAHAEFEDGEVSQELSAALEVFGALSVDRQDEIDRHMNLILSGAMQERLTSERKYEVAVERMGGDRVGRAWKFFEADPRLPMKWPIPAMRPTDTEWHHAALSSAAMTLAPVCMLVGGVTVAGVIGLALSMVGGYLVLRYTIMRESYVRYAETVWVNYRLQPYQPETKFDKLVDKCFRDVVPRDFWHFTAGYRGYLKRRLQLQYNGDECYPGELKWLIKWHVERAGRQYYPSAEPAESYRVRWTQTIGVVVWVTGLAILLFAGHLVVFVLGVAGWWGIRRIGRIACTARTQALLDRDAEDLFAEEWAEHYRSAGILVDRPSDADMAHWLALDKAYLKDEALQRANLRERDLVTHVVLTERGPFARKSRVSDGPPRYETYLVYVFLLTRYGMRTTRTSLSLATGDMRNEQRKMCTYDSVASASVVEKGVRTFLTDGRTSVDNLSGRVFQLTLTNGMCIAEVKENRRAMGDERTSGDDEPRDATIEQASGFDSALQILEAVATEGRDWIDRDRERKQRWARNWCTRSSPGDDTRTQRRYGDVPIM